MRAEMRMLVQLLLVYAIVWESHAEWEFRKRKAPREKWHRPPGTMLSCTQRKVCEELETPDHHRPNETHIIGPFEYFHSRVPNGQSGNWKVEKIVQQSGYKVHSRPFPFDHTPGVYRRLRDTSNTDREGVFMSDYFFEWYSHLRYMEKACIAGGRTLITGLGLGYIVEALHRIPGCRVLDITVIEQSADVINLIQPYLVDNFGGEDHLRIIQGDAFSYRGVYQKPKPGEMSSGGKLWDTCWHDIWQDPHSKSVAHDVKKLKRHWDRVCDWQGFWALDLQEIYAMEHKPTRHKHEL